MTRLIGLNQKNIKEKRLLNLLHLVYTETKHIDTQFANILLNAYEQIKDNKDNYKIVSDRILGSLISYNLRNTYNISTNFIDLNLLVLDIVHNN